MQKGHGIMCGSIKLTLRWNFARLVNPAVVKSNAGRLSGIIVRKAWLGFLAIGGLAAVVAGAVHLHTRASVRLLKQDYIAKASVEAQDAAKGIDQSLELIYQNLRTLASLPSVRGIDRHGDNLSPEARVTLQLIYNNLANSVSISEVYVVPASLNPDRLDPVTGRGEEPAIMFDSLILNAGAGLSEDQRETEPDTVSQTERNGPAEIELFEYRALAAQAEWFKANYPDNRAIKGLKVPVLSSAEHITCDNTYFIKSGLDEDRKGVIFSVPFFDSRGKFAGMVSAIVLRRSLAGLLPGKNYALVNPGTGVIVTRGDAGTHVTAALPLIAQGKPDPSLIFSQILPMSLREPVNPYALWAGFPDSRFTNSAEYKALAAFRLKGFGLALLILVTGSLSWGLLVRDRRRSAETAAGLRKARDDAQAAEAEASALADKFRAVNEDIAGLNRDLAAKVSELQQAQEEIVRRGRMAQLGQLTATIAHELRNPMATVQTTAFLLRRKLKDAAAGVEPQLNRIELGIRRCDDIITQLLDFARDKTPEFTKARIDDWLESVISDEAGQLNPKIAISIESGTGNAEVAFDPGRLRRAMSNILRNAEEALVGKPGHPLAIAISDPEIFIVSRLTPRGIEVAVSDNGPGIAAEVLTKVREPLFTTKNFGTGLGLPAVERILELHGGGLDIESSPGRGATFTVWFPVEWKPAKSAA